VKPLSNRIGRTFGTVALFAEAARRQARLYGPASRAIFEVLPDNRAFLKFIDRHVGGYLLSQKEFVKLIKLSAAAGAE